MKTFHRFSLIFAVILVLGLLFTACSPDGDGGSGGGNKFANTNWRSYYLSYETRLSFITSGDWAIYANYEIVGMGWNQVVAGVYTVSSGTAILRYLDQEYGKATISGNTLTLLGMAAQMGSSWTRETWNSGGNTGGGSSTGTLIIENHPPEGGGVFVCNSGPPTNYGELNQAVSKQIAIGFGGSGTWDRVAYRLTDSSIGGTFSRTGNFLVIFNTAGISYFKGNVSFNNGSATVDFNSMTSGESFLSGY
jgi:hypothetical protein